MTNYVVLAGHNYIIPGAAGNGLKEETVARTIKNAVINYLRKLGHNVIDATDEVGRTKEQVWMNAVKKANDTFGRNCIIISIHLNSGGGTGIEVFDFKGTSNPLASNISRELAAALGLRNRGQKDGSDLGIINSTAGTCVLVECGFIDNADDMRVLMANIDKAAAAIVKGATGQSVNVEPPQPKEEFIYFVTGGFNDGPSIAKFLDFVRARNWGTTASLDNFNIVFKTGAYSKGGASYNEMKKFMDDNGIWFYEIQG